MYKTEDFIMLPVPVSMYSAVCALLGGVSSAAVATADVGKAMSTLSDRTAVVGASTADASAGTGQSSAQPATQAESLASPSNGSTATTDASPSDDSGEVDAHGWPWSAELHASTKGQTKEGLWRMKPGATRPEPKPGFPKDDAPTAAAPVTESGKASEPSTPAATDEDDDEFAAFRAATAASDANETAAKASFPARKWTDADLSALCNQAAQQLGDPAPIKAIIADFVPEGQVPHSRNIADDQREAFAQAIEAKAGITFAG